MFNFVLNYIKLRNKFLGVQNQKKLKKYIWNRSIKIDLSSLKSFKNSIYIHNGRSFYEISLKSDMVGSNFGMFAFTRQKVNHIKRQKLKLVKGKKKK